MERRLLDPKSAYNNSEQHRNMKNAILSDEKRQQLWLSDLCVKYGELSITPSASSLSSTCYSGASSLSSATDYEIDNLLGAASDHTDTESTSSWNDTASSYEYYWSSSNTE